MRRLTVLAGALLLIFAGWWVVVTLSMAQDEGGPCPMNRGQGMTKYGWSWSSFGWICEARLSDGTRFRYVTRGVNPPEVVRDDIPDGP